MRLVGVHLQQTIDLVDTARPSAVAELDASGVLARLVYAAGTGDLVAAIGRDPGLVLADCPLAVANDTGRRDVEHVLAWCDVPAFPVSRRRLDQVFGGRRGSELAEVLPATLDRAETLPDLALRVLMWEEATGGSAMDLAAYRARWIAVRPPAYRPRGPGRARPAGIAAAHALLARHVDMAGWAPDEEVDDWSAIRDAAALDAIACAYVAWRAARHPGRTMRIGTPDRGEMLLPVDVNLRVRLELTLERLRAEGSIAS